MSEVLTRDEILGNFRTGRYHALNDCRWNHFLSLGIPILDKRIFEPGAGVGDQTEWLLSQGSKYIYVNEGRADNRQIIRERFLTNPKVSIIHGDLELCLSELDFYVDLIFCFGVYYHLRESDDFRILKEFPRLGKTFVFDYLAGNDNEVYYGYDNPSTSLSQYGYRPRRETVNAALKSCWEFVYLPIIPLAWKDPVATEDRVVAIGSHVKLDSPSLELVLKTAVLISGQLRTFKKCYPTQKWQIFRHYEPDTHFFVSLSGADDAARAESILREDYENVHVESYDDPVDLPDIPIQKGAHAPYANAASHHKLMLQHWGNKKVWDFFSSSAATESFDVIIRIRPDIWIHRFTPPRFEDGEIATVFCPWWGKFGGINDRLAIMGYQAAQVYMNVFDAIPRLLKLGCPFHPETLVAENLKSAGIHISNNLMTEFSTDRMDGSRRWAEIVYSDIAELIAQMAEPFKGKIPAIAEKEKRGKRIKLPKNEIYVQELTTNASINIPSSN